MTTSIEATRCLAQPCPHCRRARYRSVDAPFTSERRDDAKPATAERGHRGASHDRSGRGSPVGHSEAYRAVEENVPADFDVTGFQWASVLERIAEDLGEDQRSVV